MNKLTQTVLKYLKVAKWLGELNVLKALQEKGSCRDKQCVTRPYHDHIILSLK